LELLGGGGMGGSSNNLFLLKVVLLFLLMLHILIGRSIWVEFGGVRAIQLVLVFLLDIGVVSCICFSQMGKDDIVLDFGCKWS